MDPRTRLRALRKAAYSCAVCAARTSYVRADGLVLCTDHTAVCCGGWPYCKGHPTTPRD